MRYIATIILSLISSAAYTQSLFDIPMSRTSWYVGMPVLGAYTRCTGNGTDFTPVDSGVLAYAPGTGYDTKNDFFQYDSVYGYGYSSSGYTYRTLQLQSFDDSNHILTNTIVKLNNSTGIWQDSFRTTYTYDNDNNILSLTTQVFDAANVAWKNLTKHQYAYDTADNRIVDASQVWSDTSVLWTNINVHIYQYDVNRNLVRDSAVDWVDSLHQYAFSFLIVNDYNSFNQIQTRDSYPPMPPAYRYEYEYDTKTHLLNDKIFEKSAPPPGVWFKSSYVYYFYDDYNNLKSESQFGEYENTYHYDTLHNLIESIHAIWYPSPPPHMGYSNQTLFSYNKYKQITLYTTSLWDDVNEAWIPQTQYRYYYEPAPPPKKTGIPNVVQPNFSVQLYPSPANSILNIDLSMDREQSAVVSIYDVTGRLWAQWQLAPAAFSHNNYPVSQLPAGEYILSIKTKTGNISKAFSVIH